MGRGILLGGITGVAPSAVVIIGAGVVGTTAARAAMGRGAQVIVLDKNLNRLKRIDETFQKKITTVVANPYTIARGVKFADVLIGAVLIKGEKAPHIVTEEMIKCGNTGDLNRRNLHKARNLVHVLTGEVAEFILDLLKYGNKIAFAIPSFHTVFYVLYNVLW